MSTPQNRLGNNTEGSQLGWRLHEQSCLVWLCSPRKCHEDRICDCACSCGKETNIIDFANELLAAQKKSFVEKIEGLKKTEKDWTGQYDGDPKYERGQGFNSGIAKAIEVIDAEV